VRSTARYRFYLLAALILSFGGLAAVILTDTNPRLGLDLEGGTSVILTATGEEVREDVLQQTVEIIRQRIDALGVAEPEVSIGGTDNILIQLPGVEDEEEALEVIGSTAQLTFRQVRRVIPPGTPDARHPEITESNSQDVNDEVVVYPDAEEPNTLFVLEPAGGLTGDIVRRAEAVPEQGGIGGRWVVSIDMNQSGSSLWADLTSKLSCLRDENPASPKAQVAIVLDGRVESAAGMDPQVLCNEGIRGGQTQIDVGSQAEAKQLALVLRTGALPLTLEQSEVQKVSPSLGRDSLNAGIKAGAIGLVLVFIYMVLYYRALALVVLLGLGVFAASLYTVMALLGESAGLSLSLAGVAGVIVSVGVTADSYIVAFERLKDEVRSGKSVRAAVDRGMVRSFKTILVADFVTGSAAVILFLLAVGPVRGFALTLGIATVIDVLIAYYFTRSAVTLLARSKMFGSGRFIGIRDALGAES
jgi:protein-export membrane protein SecD